MNLDYFVIPAEAGIQDWLKLLDSRSPIRSRTRFTGMTIASGFFM